MKSEKPVDSSGEIKGGLPRNMIMGFGPQGISRSGDGISVNLTSRVLFSIRKRHAYLCAMHNAIAKQVSKVELCVEVIDKSKKYDVKTKERMEKFIREGFGPEGEKTFRGNFIDVKKWNGMAFAEVVYDSTTHEPKIVKSLMAETMRILPDEHGNIIAFPQIVDGILANEFSPENIIYLREHVNEYSLFGWSDIESLLGAILVDSLADEHTSAKLANDATPPGILCFNGNEVDETMLRRWRAEFITQLRQNPGKPVFIGTQIQWIPMAIGSLKDMDFQELHRQVKEKLMMVYSVLPMQVSVVETGRLANPEQQLEIGGEYIKQEIEKICEMYNLRFTPHFSNPDNLRFAFSELEPKMETIKMQAEIGKILAETARSLSSIPGAYTINEIRKITNHEETEWGGEIVQQPAQQFVSAGFGDFPRKGMAESIKPFADYENFDDCVAQNQDKDNPEKFCGYLMSASEKSAMPAKAKNMNESFLRIYGSFMREAVSAAANKYRTKSYDGFMKNLEALSEKLAKKLKESAASNALAVFVDSKELVGSSFNQQDERAIELLLSRKEGAFEALGSFSSEQKENLLEVFSKAYESGLDVRELKTEMAKLSDMESWKLERIARTETHRISNQGRAAGYKELEDERSEKYKYNWGPNPIDDRTSDICLDIIAGNPYTLEEIMDATDGGVPHPNCRHSITRVVE